MRRIQRNWCTCPSFRATAAGSELLLLPASMRSLAFVASIGSDGGSGDWYGKAFVFV
jgi:hypothetical protein